MEATRVAVGRASPPRGPLSPARALAAALARAAPARAAPSPPPAPPGAALVSAMSPPARPPAAALVAALTPKGQPPAAAKMPVQVPQNLPPAASSRWIYPQTSTRPAARNPTFHLSAVAQPVAQKSNNHPSSATAPVPCNHPSAAAQVPCNHPSAATQVPNNHPSAAAQPVAQVPNIHPSATAQPVAQVPNNHPSAAAQLVAQVPNIHPSAAAQPVAQVPNNHPSAAAQPVVQVPNNHPSAAAQPVVQVPNNHPSAAAQPVALVPNNHPSAAAQPVALVPNNHPSAAAQPVAQVPNNHPSAAAQPVVQVPNNHPSASAQPVVQVPNNHPSASAQPVVQVPNNHPSAAAQPVVQVPNNHPSAAAQPVALVPNNHPSAAAQPVAQVPNNHPSAAAQPVALVSNNHPSAAAQPVAQVPNNHPSVAAQPVVQVPNNHPSASAQPVVQVPNNHPSAAAQPVVQVPNNHPSASAQPVVQVPNNHPSAAAQPVAQVPNNHPSAAAQPPAQIPNHHAAAVVLHPAPVSQNHPPAAAPILNKYPPAAAPLSQNHLPAAQVLRNLPPAAALGTTQVPLKHLPAVFLPTAQMPHNRPPTGARAAADVSHTQPPAAGLLPAPGARLRAAAALLPPAGGPRAAGAQLRAAAALLPTPGGPSPPAGRPAWPSSPRRQPYSYYGPRPAAPQKEDEREIRRKVLVTGFPSYTQLSEITRVLAQFGPPLIHKCRNRLAVVEFATEEEAAAAVRANNQLAIYGECITIKKYTSARHVEDLIRANRRIKNEQQDDLVNPKEIDLSGDFYQQVENIEKAIRLTKEEMDKVGEVYRDLETVLQQAYPGCELVPFGSITTGLGLKSSDADCFVRLPPRFHAPGHDVSFVHRARRLLATHGGFDELVAIPRANTPILKFVHRATRTRGDLSCKTPLGTLNSRLLAHLLADPRHATAALLLKYWARVHRLGGSGRLTNYALVLLLVFYLQARGLLPGVARLQAACAAPLLVDGWDASFAPLAPPRAEPAPTLPDLFGGFFEFYAEFDFATLVVCPYLGAAVPKAAFAGEAAPPPFLRYLAAVRARRAGPLRHASALCVQDPFEHSHNVAAGVSPRLAALLLAHVRAAAASYAAARPDCAPLLRAVLLRAPRAARVLRVRVAERLLPPAPSWRADVRALLLDVVFARMMGLRAVPADADDRSDEEEEAAPTEAEEERAEAAERERYRATLQVPLWVRRKFANPRVFSAAALEARERSVTARLLAAPEMRLAAPARLRVELAFAERPRALTLSLEVEEGPADALAGLTRLLHVVEQSWLPILVGEARRAPPAP